MNVSQYYPDEVRMGPDGVPLLRSSQRSAKHRLALFSTEKEKASAAIPREEVSSAVSC